MGADYWKLMVAFVISFIGAVVLLGFSASEIATEHEILLAAAGTQGACYAYANDYVTGVSDYSIDYWAYASPAVNRTQYIPTATISPVIGNITCYSQNFADQMAYVVLYAPGGYSIWLLGLAVGVAVTLTTGITLICWTWLECQRDAHLVMFDEAV